jgi:peptide/nickel transport system ATP-binding protein
MSSQGEVPSPINLPPGCAFASRCKLPNDICHHLTPPLSPVEKGHEVACFHPL